MKRKRLLLFFVGIFVLAGVSFAYAIFWWGFSSGAGIESFKATLQGLNQDMRETLHKVREGHEAEKNIELLHDQLHLMRRILHLVNKEYREKEPFMTLHNLSHTMRDTWHEIKKGRDLETNYGKLHDQLHEMKGILEKIAGKESP